MNDKTHEAKKCVNKLQCIYHSREAHKNMWKEQGDIHSLGKMAMNTSLKKSPFVFFLVGQKSKKMDIKIKVFKVNGKR